MILTPFVGIPLGDGNLRFKQNLVVLSAKRSAEVRYSREVEIKRTSPKKGRQAERLLAALKELQRGGRKVNRIQINEAKHVLYREAGQLFFVCALRVDLEFPQGRQE